MLLPDGSHAVRLCVMSTLGDDGEITAACFFPHKGTDLRAADRYLSVHWLEYLGGVEVSGRLQVLRDFLLNSTIPGERKPTAKGKLAVLACDQVVAQAPQVMQVEVRFAHEPRTANPASGVSISPDGVVTIGVDVPLALASGQSLDPHSGLFTFPEEASHQLAVQQFLVAQVFHTEPGRH